jgi:hypothetical protein
LLLGIPVVLSLFAGAYLISYSVLGLATVCLAALIPLGADGFGFQLAVLLVIPGCALTAIGFYGGVYIARRLTPPKEYPHAKPEHENRPPVLESDDRPD